MVLESRSSLRQTLFTIIYLPIVYTVFGLILGEFITIATNESQMLVYSFHNSHILIIFK